MSFEGLLFVNPVLHILSIYSNQLLNTVEYTISYRLLTVERMQ